MVAVSSMDVVNLDRSLASLTESMESSLACVSSVGDVGLGGLNSPCALSREARPCGTLANHPPGKNSEDAVDSNLVRVVGDGNSKDEDIVLVTVSSLSGLRDSLDLFKMTVSIRLCRTE